VGPKDFATKIINDTSTVPEDLPTMSTVEMAKMHEVGNKMAAFSEAILSTENSMSELKSLVYKTQSFSGFKDIYDFAKRVAESENLTDENLKTAANDVMASLKEAIVAEQHSTRYPDAHGLQIKLSSWGSPGADYQDLAFAKDTKWAEAQEKIAGAKGEAEPTEVPDGPGGDYPDFDWGYMSE
jgi:hypothetical protein